MKSKTFVFHGEWMEAIGGLPSDVRLEIYDAIVEYGLSGTIPQLKPMAALAINFVKNDIDRDRERYDEAIRQRVEAGKRSAEARKATKANEAQRDSTEGNESQRSLTSVDERSSSLEVVQRDSTEGNYNVYVDDNVIEEKEPKGSKKKFSPPSVDDVAALCKERGYTATNPSAFVAYYESNGWRVGKNPMRSWESALAGWEVREKERGKAVKPTEIGRTEFSHNYNDPW